MCAITPALMARTERRTRPCGLGVEERGEVDHATPPFAGRAARTRSADISSPADSGAGRRRGSSQSTSRWRGGRRHTARRSAGCGLGFTIRSADAQCADLGDHQQVRGEPVNRRHRERVQADRLAQLLGVAHENLMARGSQVAIRRPSGPLEFLATIRSARRATRRSVACRSGTAMRISRRPRPDRRRRCRGGPGRALYPLERARLLEVLERRPRALSRHRCARSASRPRAATPSALAAPIRSVAIRQAFGAAPARRGWT